MQSPFGRNTGRYPRENVQAWDKVGRARFPIRDMTLFPLSVRHARIKDIFICACETFGSRWNRWRGTNSRTVEKQLGETGVGGLEVVSKHSLPVARGVITRQSHLSQNCESFIRHNDPCPITSHATYDRDLYYCGE